MTSFWQEVIRLLGVALDKLLADYPQTDSQAE